MSALPPVTPSGPSAAPARETGRTSLTQTDFLKLLTAQLANQDPTSPVENAEFVSQMAQLSTVDGIDRLNGGIGQLQQTLTAIAERIDRALPEHFAAQTTTDPVAGPAAA